MFFSNIYKKKHQTFSYTPRSYDPKKEAFRKRLEAAKKAKEEGIEATKYRIGQGFKHSKDVDRRHFKKQVLKSNLLVVMIAIILCILAYYFIIEYLPKIVEAFE